MKLTETIQRLIDQGSKVYAFQLNSDEVGVDINDPITYWQALKLSYDDHRLGILLIIRQKVKLSNLWHSFCRVGVALKEWSDLRPSLIAV